MGLVLQSHDLQAGYECSSVASFLKCVQAQHVHLLTSLGTLRSEVLQLQSLRFRWRRLF